MPGPCLPEKGPVAVPGVSTNLRFYSSSQKYVRIDEALMASGSHQSLAAIWITKHYFENHYNANLDELVKSLL